MRQAGPIVVTRRREEDLCLVFEAPERLAMDHAVAVTLKGGADRIFRLRAKPPARLAALGRLRREDLLLALLQLFTYVRHALTPTFIPTSTSVINTSTNA